MEYKRGIARRTMQRCVIVLAAGASALTASAALADGNKDGNKTEIIKTDDGPIQGFREMS